MTPDEARYFANPGAGAFNPNFYFHWEDFNNEPVCAGDKPGTGEWALHLDASLYPYGASAHWVLHRG